VKDQRRCTSQRLYVSVHHRDSASAKEEDALCICCVGVVCRPSRTVPQILSYKGFTDAFGRAHQEQDRLRELEIAFPSRVLQILAPSQILRSFPVTSKALSKVDHHQRLPVAPDHVYSRGYDVGCTGLCSFCDPVKALTGTAEDGMLSPGFCLLQSNHFLMVSRVGARRSAPGAGSQPGPFGSLPLRHVAWPRASSSTQARPGRILAFPHCGCAMLPVGQP